MILRTLVVLYSVLGIASANASEIEVFMPPGSSVSIEMVSGEIVEGDAFKLSDAVSGLSQATIILRGPGGLISEAFGMGAVIRTRNFATLVAPDTECFSACALVWLAGARRYTSDEAIIGVHAAYYTTDDATPSVSGAGNAEIGAYLSQMGLRREAIRYITTAEPDEEFLFLTPRVSRALGIEIYEQDGFEITTPAQEPTAARIAYRVARLVALESDCGILVGTGGRAQALAEVELERGHAAFGGEIFATLLPEAVEEVRAEVSLEGRLAWCINKTTGFVRDGLQIGIDGPSFECNRAATANELAICRTPSLWVLDRVMAAFYGAAKRAWPEARQSTLRANQSAWLKWRQQCGSDVKCAEVAYHTRISDLLR